MENIFEYDLTELELEVFKLAYDNESSYILFTPQIKILSDLHLLFLMRHDKENCARIMQKIKYFTIKDISKN